MIAQSTRQAVPGIVALSAGLFLAACGSAPPSKDDGRGTYKVGQTYTVMGQTYTPHEDLSYSETGVASWYGPGFHGKYTANGEYYNQSELTAAHRTLPMPSMVLVTNLDNGRSVMVRVNDRGPFARERIIDVSRAAAEELQMTGPGVANVRVDILRRESEMVKDVAINGGGPSEQLAALVQSHRDRVAAARAPAAPAPRPSPAAPPPPAIAMAPSPLPPQTAAPPVGSRPTFFVQAGAYGSLANAERAKSRISAIGDTVIMPITVNGQELYRLRVGPIGDGPTADSTLLRVQRAGFVDARVVVD